MRLLRINILQLGVGSELAETLLARPVFGGTHQRSSHALPSQIIVNIPAFKVSDRTCPASFSQRPRSNFGKTRKPGTCCPRRNEHDRVRTSQPCSHFFAMLLGAEFRPKCLAHPQPLWIVSFESLADVHKQRFRVRLVPFTALQGCIARARRSMGVLF